MTDLQKPGDLIPALAAAYNEGHKRIHPAGAAYRD